MIHVYFFASVRETVGRPELQLDWLPATVADLISSLAAEHAALRDEQLLYAVNQEMVDKDHPLKEGDEVGVFPPVTGG